MKLEVGCKQIANKTSEFSGFLMANRHWPFRNCENCSFVTERTFKFKMPSRSRSNFSKICIANQTFQKASQVCPVSHSKATQQKRPLNDSLFLGSPSEIHDLPIAARVSQPKTKWRLFAVTFLSDGPVFHGRNIS